MSTADDMPKKMNPAVKAMWVADLRSGAFPQGHALLRNRQGGYCCLGVQCARAVAEGIIPAPVVDRYGTTHFGGNPEIDWESSSDIYLPPAVAEWAGLGESDPWVWVTIDGERVKRTLSKLNDDDGCTLAEIADLIDEQL